MTSIRAEAISPFLTEASNVNPSGLTGVDVPSIRLSFALVLSPTFTGSGVSALSVYAMSSNPAVQNREGVAVACIVST